MAYRSLPTIWNARVANFFSCNLYCDSLGVSYHWTVMSSNLKHFEDHLQLEFDPPVIQRTSVTTCPLCTENMYVPGVDSLIKFTDRVKKRWSGSSPYSTYSPYINIGSGSTGSQLTAVAYGKGEKKTRKIPDGQTFAGRSEGGMTREKIYGTNVYGSGYISKSDQALGTVSGKSFPSYFWPIDWSTSSSSSSGYDNGDSWDDSGDDSNWDGSTWNDNSNGWNNGNNNGNNNNNNGNSWNNGNNNGWNNYAVDSDNSTSNAVNVSSNWYSGSGTNSEFGGPTNPNRPGGALAYATFTSSDYSTTALVLADNATLSSIINTTTYECSNYLSDPSGIYVNSFDGWDSNEPQQNQAVQYYRASSVVLTVQNSNGNGNSGNYNNGGYGNNNNGGYNSGYNSNGGGYSTYSTYGSGNTGYSSYNSYGSMVDCLNRTIGASVPLVGSAFSWAQPGHMMGSLSLFWVLGAMLYALF